jgi:hypothetical protein
MRNVSHVFSGGKRPRAASMLGARVAMDYGNAEQPAGGRTNFYREIGPLA